MPEKFSAMRQSDDLKRSSDSLSGNQDSPSLEQLNNKAKQQKIQNKSRETLNKQDQKNADYILTEDLNKLDITIQKDLDSFLDSNFPNDLEAKIIAQDYFNKQSTLGFSVSEKIIKNHITERLNSDNKLSTEDKIKNYTETIRDKPQVEILRLLIARFKNENGVETLIDNFRNFLKLHQFAESKSPKERKEIERIISKADFTSENAFSTSLAEISQSAEISNETKLEISREFSGADVFSVDDLDFTLKGVKNHQKKIENAISTKSREKNTLDSEIESLEDELDTLPLGDPKRLELEKELQQRKRSLDETEAEISRLEEGKPKDLAFTLRQGFSAKLNPDGSRSISVDNEDFAIKLPSNKWLFSDKKNIRAINLAFPYIVLRNQNIADLIFSPNLNNDSVPSRENRKMGHLILSSLGFDDSRILSEENIKQLNKDLSRLTSVQNGKSAEEKLINLEIYDITLQNVDKEKLKSVLVFIRENRGLEAGVFFERLKELTI